MTKNTPAQNRAIRNMAARRKTALSAPDALLKFPNTRDAASMSTSTYIASFRRLNELRTAASKHHKWYYTRDQVHVLNFLPHAFVNLHGVEL